MPSFHVLLESEFSSYNRFRNCDHLRNTHRRINRDKTFILQELLVSTIDRLMKTKILFVKTRHFSTRSHTTRQCRLRRDIAKKIEVGRYITEHFRIHEFEELCMLFFPPRGDLICIRRRIKTITDHMSSTQKRRKNDLIKMFCSPCFKQKQLGHRTHLCIKNERT